jgi:hypothetical protein
MFPKIIKLILAVLTIAFSVFQFIEGAIGWNVHFTLL